jgi:hypothetical protein
VGLIHDRFGWHGLRESHVTFSMHTRPEVR